MFMLVAETIYVKEGATHSHLVNQIKSNIHEPGKLFDFH